MPTDPLSQLCADIDRDGRASLAWCLEHAPSGDLDAALVRCWAETSDPEAMMRLYARTPDARGLVWAACACARVAGPGLERFDPRPGAALAAAEGWVRGGVSRERVAEAAAHARAAAEELYRSGASYFTSSARAEYECDPHAEEHQVRIAAVPAAHAAARAAELAAPTDMRLRANSAGAAVTSALACNGLSAGFLAEVVRAVLKAPSYGDLAIA